MGLVHVRVQMNSQGVAEYRTSIMLKKLKTQLLGLLQVLSGGGVTRATPPPSWLGSAVVLTEPADTLVGRIILRCRIVTLDNHRGRIAVRDGPFGDATGRRGCPVVGPGRRSRRRTRRASTARTRSQATSSGEVVTLRIRIAFRAILAETGVPMRELRRTIRQA